MNVRIERIILRCRGIEPATAQAAVGELGPGLLRRLRQGGGEASAADTPIPLGATAAPRGLAGVVADRVAAAVESQAPPRNQEKT
jgi:hypothetical protein